MIQKLKKIFSIIFGSQDNIFFKVSFASLITSIILALFAWLFTADYIASNFFTFTCALFFTVWIILTRGFNSAEKLIYELIRLLCFFTAFIWSLNCFLHLNSYNKIHFYIAGSLSCIGLFFSCIYFISKLNDIFDFVRTIFKQIKIKLFNTDKPTPSGIKSVIENITVFLVSIGGFSIAIKTIIETVFQILDYFK